MLGGYSMRGLTVGLGAAALAFAMGAAPARADDTGFASIHDLAMVGSKVCMTDHSHNGTGDTASSRKAAELSAIRSWASFTALEYGTDWANFGLSVGKAMSCSQNSGGWQCSVDARACRNGRAGYAAAGAKAKAAASRAGRAAAPKRQAAQ